MNQEKREDSKAIQTSHPFQILCLDGGGIKGLFSAAILAHLEEDFHIKITDYFDLIVGTSTGGIIALALGIGLRPREIVHFYVSNGNSIFANRWPLKLRQLWHLSRYFIRNKYDSEPLEKALKDCFGDKLLAESKKRVVIPSYNIGEDDIYLFKTPHHERLRRDYKVPVWKVAMATSAAPTYFPCFRGLNDIRLIDGGVWVSIPVQTGH
jgi:patatin-like phospholipase/acyl hydrolase